MANSDANKWYDAYKRKMLEELGINMSRQEDMSRLFVPEMDGSGMRPLFEKGFTATDQQQEELYNYAKSGQLFAISKWDNEAYQVGDDRIQSVDKVVEKENGKVSTAKRVGYSVISTIGAPIVWALGVAKRVLSIGGILSKPLDLIEEGLSLMTSGLAERIFSVKQQKMEDKNRITLGDRVVNILSFGVQRADKIKAVGHENTLANMCLRSKEDLDKKVKEVKEREKKAAEKRKQEKNISPQEKELKDTKEKIKTIQNQKNKQVENENVNTAKIENTKQQNLNMEDLNLDGLNLEDLDLGNVDLEEDTVKQSNVNIKTNSNIKENVNADPNVKVDVEVKNTNTQQTGNNNDNNKPNEKSGKEMKTQLGAMYDELRESFGMPGGFDEAAKIAQNMNQLIQEFKKNPDKMLDSGMSEKDLKGLSNMCNNLTSVYEKGLEAKEILLQPEKSKDLPEAEKENRVADLLLMNMFQNAMVNSSLNAKLNGGEMKSPGIFNSMVKNPEDYRKGWTDMIKGIDVTKSLMEMSPKEVSDYVANSREIRKSITDNIHDMAGKIRTVREQVAQKQMQVQNERQGVEKEQNQVQQQQTQQQDMEVNQMQAV